MKAIQLMFEKVMCEAAGIRDGSANGKASENAVAKGGCMSGWKIQNGLWCDFQRPAVPIPFICRTFPRESRPLAPAKSCD
ncbi:hypothetical protein F0169_19855 [Pseudomonas sp. MAFF 212408]|uniref:Uncharacterized protein n=1 Tax=Pseudomonas kitaguniensis TaxID=2607908 RepID=A0A5N7KPL6_9PSED|nr:hypothetical protein [Pseudomonas kitaguniensis]MPR04133.1 hypothetical protein [Pseudomonas kitaguniensis]